MFPKLSFTVLAFFCATTSAVVLPRSSAVHLAVSPQCGTLSSGVPADVNVGLGPLSSYKTIVAFGDSYTNGNCNGPTWVQNLATSIGAKLINYAVSGTEADGNVANTFMTTQKLDPATTLYIVFFGIGDKCCRLIAISATGKTNMNQIAGVLVYTMLGLTSSQSFAKNILIVDNYGLGKTSPAGDAFKTDLFVSLGTGHRLYGWNVGFASFKGIWEGVLYGSPGYAAFGYTNPGTCVQSSGSTCADPAHTFYWSPGNPSAATHAIMATYVQEVLTQCISSS
ncbi:hypothetical protein B0H10DRAFT_1819515 [Mycena sp. CBHHK59/15]|nr:hypothetical protein B0H10DRAFT_1819515 [Mycena sp. CBHHK59/15]